jgi:hypothetical protein
MDLSMLTTENVIGKRKLQHSPRLSLNAGPVGLSSLKYWSQKVCLTGFKIHAMGSTKFSQQLRDSFGFLFGISIKTRLF